jgi:hypothetical protein
MGTCGFSGVLYNGGTNVANENNPAIYALDKEEQ